MSNYEKTCKRLEYALGIALLFLTPSTKAEADPDPLPLAVLKTVPIEVDIASLPASEQAALVPILRAARQLDVLYMRQVWPGTRALIDGRRPAASSLVGGEFDALNFFKGPWGPTGKPFVGGVPAEQPIGDFYPPGMTKHDIEVWLGTLSESDHKRALDPFTVLKLRYA